MCLVCWSVSLISVGVLLSCLHCWLGCYGFHVQLCTRLLFAVSTNILPVWHVAILFVPLWVYALVAALVARLQAIWRSVPSFCVLLLYSGSSGPYFPRGDCFYNLLWLSNLLHWFGLPAILAYTFPNSAGGYAVCVYFLRDFNSDLIA